MNWYKGNYGQTDQIYGGGEYVDRHGTGMEVCNFLPDDEGFLFGYIKSVRGNQILNLGIERLGASKSDRYVDGITVVWIATHPSRRGQYVVGWYDNARVYRQRQQHDWPPTGQHKADDVEIYNIVGHEDDARLLPPERRFQLELGRGKGWLGQAALWYPEEKNNNEIQNWLSYLKTSIIEDVIRSDVGAKNGPRGRNDTLDRLKTEAAAIDFVTNYYVSFGYVVRSVETENCGWDLEVENNGSSTFRVEVKGRSASNTSVELTPNEYRVLKNHVKGKDKKYRLAIIICAKSSPQMYLLRFDQKKRKWLSETTSTIIELEVVSREGAQVTV